MKHASCGSARGFLKGGKYDKLACIPDDDANVTCSRRGKRVIRFGDATYEVVGRCEHGAAYHARLIWRKVAA